MYCLLSVSAFCIDHIDSCFEQLVCLNCCITCFRCLRLHHLLKMPRRASFIWLSAAQMVSMLWRKSRHECKAALTTIITLKTHQGLYFGHCRYYVYGKFKQTVSQLHTSDFLGIKDLFVNVSLVQWLSDVWFCNLLELSWSLICLNSCKNGIVSPTRISIGWQKTIRWQNNEQLTLDPAGQTGIYLRIVYVL